MTYIEVMQTLTVVLMSTATVGCIFFVAISIRNFYRHKDR